MALALLAAAPLRAEWGAWIPALHPALRWEGRLRFAPDRSAVYDWASVRLHLQVHATELAFFVRPGRNTLDVFVDGERAGVISAAKPPADAAWAGLALRHFDSGGTPVYVLGGLTPGAHTLCVAKRTGPNFGPVDFMGLRLDAQGSLDAAPPAPQRRLEVIGDSLSNAYGTEGPGKQCKDLAPYENSSRSWARVCADALHADLQLLAFSGYGLVRNYGAPGESSDDPMPFYYPRRVLAETRPLWLRDGFVPDLSVVFLGTNDYSTRPHPRDADFEDAYRAFLDQVRKGRGGLKILLAYVDDGSTLARRIKAVAESQQMVGRWVETLALPKAPDKALGCDWHPKASVQQEWAEVAEARIRKVLDWQ